MFMAIITSGHMPEDIITNVATGAEVETFPERLILRILMRQDYRFFSDNSGFIANLFYCDRQWERPSNFVVVEALFYLTLYSKNVGDNGQMGFIAVERVLLHLEQFGFVRGDIFGAVLYLLRKELIEADSATATILAEEDCVRVTASGWAHLRILSSRAEYIGSVLPTTSLNDPKLKARVYDSMQIESRYGGSTRGQTAGVVQAFYEYLVAQWNSLKVHPGYVRPGQNGAAYILSKISDALAFERSGTTPPVVEPDWLDL
jgi:hypothetical protein